MKKSDVFAVAAMCVGSVGWVTGCAKMQETMARAGVPMGQAAPVAGLVMGMMEKQDTEAKQKILNTDVAQQKLDEMVATASQDLGQRLVAIPEVKASQTQKILTITEVVNKTSVSGGDAEIAGALASLKAKLVSDERVHSAYVVVDRSRQSAMQLTNEIAGAGNDPNKLRDFDDPAQRSASTTTAVVYHPDDIYILSGEFFYIDNKSQPAVQKDPTQRKVAYKLIINVLHGRSGVSALTKEYDKNFHWDGKQFVPEA